MAKKIPQVESLIVVAFLLSVALWAISKCSESRRERIRRAPTEEEELRAQERPAPKRDTVYLPQPQPTASAPAPAGPPQTASPAAPQPTPAGPPPKRPTLTPEPQPAPTAAPPTAAQYSTLYVTIDGLNVRKEPNRHSAVVERLKLHAPVLYLNKKSDQPEEINLGREKVTDYWVNIRTPSGKEGWVFGAGVHYYPMKRPGVE
ncbi:MAG: SH3 domain-containing protein [Saprospiraceae bacterium]|nr:SH3 domain-containing protein [Saprospiraceae bacterium]MDW8229389.1 SH3 domain-containing protein [Saprospiraceae bacterium]